ncbi:MAG: ygiD [Frankiales bacterium]|nr:ygiD [Frankiales bacterium]
MCVSVMDRVTSASTLRCLRSRAPVNGVMHSMANNDTGGCVTSNVEGSTVMPAAFFGHGNPMNALETNRYTRAWRPWRAWRAWRAFGESVPRPRAILVV